MNIRRLSATSYLLLLAMLGAGLFLMGCSSESTLSSLERSVESRVSSLSLNVASSEIAVSQTEILVASLSPSDAANKNVSWSSSDATVASVNASGLVTGLKAGSVTITASSEDSGVTASCQLQVIAPIADTLTVVIGGASSTLLQGNVQNLTASLATDTSATVTFRWYVNGVQVATGDSYSFGADFAAGIYRIDVVAFSADGSQAGSTSTLIQITNS